MENSSFYASDPSVNSIFSTMDFVPDGKLEKAEWIKAERFRFDRTWVGGKRLPETETQVASLWTSQYIYFAFWCKYQKLNIYEGEDALKERWELWNRDVVEIFLNPQPTRTKHYFEFEVAPNNQWIDLEIDLGKKPFNDAGWDSHFGHATQVDESKRIWTCEMRIPLGSIKAPAIGAGQNWRINFYRADGLGDDSQRRFLSWSPNPTGKPTFHQPASFGIIRFKKT